MGYPFNGKIAQYARTKGNVTVDRHTLYHHDIMATTAGAETIKLSVTLSTALQTITTFASQPDVPRQILLTKNDNATAGDVVITGTNIANATITETIALTVGATTDVSTKAFKTITSIVYPIRTAPGDWIKVGTNQLVGLPDWFTVDSIVKVLFDGSSVAYTLTPDSNEVEKNLIEGTGTTWNAAKVMHIWWFN